MKKILYRGVKTFMQSALSVVVASAGGFLKVDVWQGALVAGLAALFSFVYNTVSDWEP